MFMRTMGCLLALALVLPACAVGGGDHVPSAIYSLGGEWVGWFEDDAAVSHDFVMILDRSGRVTHFYLDNDLQDYTGVVRQDTAEGFEILFSTGGGAVMVVDPLVRHCVYFDASGGFGVLQKYPPADWSYLFAEPVGDWSGFAYIYDSRAGGFSRYEPWDITIASGTLELPFAGTDELGDSFGGGITEYDDYFGWYWGYIDVPVTTEIFGGLSPDKQFFGGYIGEHGVDAWPEEFWFLLLTRQ